MMMKKRLTFASAGVVALLMMFAAALFAGHAQASVFKRAQNLDITNLEQLDDDVYIYANKLTLEGVVRGDLTAFCYRVDVKGEVGQSANLFCRDLFLAGKIDGSLRAFAQNAVIDGYVSRSAIAFGQDVSFNQGSVVERDLTAAGGVVDLAGTVRGNTRIYADRVVLSGVFMGDVNIDADQIQVVKPAVITGNLTYVSKTEAKIDTANGVSITGQTTWNLPKHAREEKSGSGLTGFLLRVSSLLAAFIFGLIVMQIFRPYAEESFNQLRTRLSTSIAAGLIGIVSLLVCLIILVLALAFSIAGLILVSSQLAPIGSIILIFSILTIPITSFLGVSGAIILYSGKLVVAMLLGYLIMSRAREGTQPLGKAGLFVGLTILAVVFAIPYLGTIVYIAAAVVGGGAILLGIKHCRRPVWRTASTSTPPAASPLDTQGQA